jgi:hypothetical protein
MQATQHLTVKANASIVPSLVQSTNQPLHLTVKARVLSPPSPDVAINVPRLFSTLWTHGAAAAARS